MMNENIWSFVYTVDSVRYNAFIAIDLGNNSASYIYIYIYIGLQVFEGGNFELQLYFKSLGCIRSTSYRKCCVCIDIFDIYLREHRIVD